MTSMAGGGNEPEPVSGHERTLSGGWWRAAFKARYLGSGSVPSGKPAPPQSSDSTFAFEDAIRYEPDKRNAGYYVDNGDDWPDEVSAANISARELFDVVSRYADVYDSAMVDISKDPATP